MSQTVEEVQFSFRYLFFILTSVVKWEHKKYHAEKELRKYCSSRQASWKLCIKNVLQKTIKRIKITGQPKT